MQPRGSGVAGYDTHCWEEVEDQPSCYLWRYDVKVSGREIEPGQCVDGRVNGEATVTDRHSVIWQGAYANGLRQGPWTVTGPDFVEQIRYAEGRMRGSRRLQGDPAMTATELVALLYSEGGDYRVFQGRLRARGVRIPLGMNSFTELYEVGVPYDLLAEAFRLAREAQPVAASGHGPQGSAPENPSARAPLRPGDSFSDPLASSGSGPQMVVVPAGTFRMGCVSVVDNCDGVEWPVREVSIPQDFAVSLHEITFGEWEHCMSMGECGVGGSRGWGHMPPTIRRDEEGSDHPVTGVRWNLAREFVDWLSRETGHTYRLLSEAEWEYAARAGSATQYHWGNEIGLGRANCSGCGGEWDGTGTSPVGSFEPNAFGLYDMHGNAAEVVEDCWKTWHDDASPVDGSAWTSRRCRRHSVRGGSWDDSPRMIRSSSRDFGGGSGVGFRVVRVIDP